MMAPVGATVRITYDYGGLPELGPGHALMTPTGRIYIVTCARRQTRGKYAGIRWHLRCVVADREAFRGGYVHPLYWNRRERKRGGR